MSVLERILIYTKDAEAMVAFYGGRWVLSCPHSPIGLGAAASSTSTYLPK